jgi:hypothetical protein
MIKVLEPPSVCNKMATLTDIEVGMQKNDEDIEACLQLYVGMSWSEYVKSGGGINHMIGLPPVVPAGHVPGLPRGMVDAAEFLKIVTEKELLITQCKEKVKACIQQIYDIEKAEALIGQAIHVHGVRGFGRQDVKAQLIDVRERCIGEEKRLNLELWNLSELNAVDAVSFQAELTYLLKSKLELRLSHKKSIALRMVELRGNEPTAH